MDYLLDILSWTIVNYGTDLCPFKIRYMFCVYAVFFNDRLGVPVALRKTILHLLHKGHPDRDQTVARAQHVYH